jgi:hypothetical protein
MVQLCLLCAWSVFDGMFWTCCVCVCALHQYLNLIVYRWIYWVMYCFVLIKLYPSVIFFSLRGFLVCLLYEGFNYCCWTLFLFVIRSLLHALCRGQSCPCTLRAKCLSILLLRVFGLNLCIHFHFPCTCYIFFPSIFFIALTVSE